MTTLAEDVHAKLEQIFDPEIPVNIVDLGLIYGVQVDGSKAIIKMTLTTPACPEAQRIPAIVKERCATVPGIEDVQVDIVWEPKWTVQRISAEGRKILGIEDQEEA